MNANNAAANVDEYISGFPEEVQERLQQMRAAIREAVPDAEEMISYAMPTLKTHGMVLVHYAAFKNHIGFYATPTGHAAFVEDLAGYKQGRGSVQFPFGEPLPLNLIRRIAAFRAQENAEKAAEKKK